MSGQKPKSFIWDEVKNEAVEFKKRLALSLAKDFKPIHIESKYGNLIPITSNRSPCVLIKRGFKK
jgi:hypothetical protein